MGIHIYGEGLTQDNTNMIVQELPGSYSIVARPEPRSGAGHSLCVTV